MLRTTSISLPAAVLLLCSPLGAQQVEVQLREDSTRAPVAGAIVRLLGGNVIVAQGLTGEQGRIVLRAPGPGAYRIRVDRIGWSGVLTAPLDLLAGETVRKEVLMPSTRISLPTLEVRGRSRCEASGQGGPLVAALWEEIQKALTANVLTHRERAAPVHLRRFVREVARDGRIQRQWVVRSTLVRGAPFGSLSPAALAARGFVEEAGDSVAFNGPDAALLLTDEFVATHCFKAVPGADMLVGLAFEPIPGREVADVRGTLWVNRLTSELQFLEYTYTGLTGDLERAKLGGRLEFRRAPSGAWIVSYWHIRMPRMETRQLHLVDRSVSDSRMIGYLDRGGRAEIATDQRGVVNRAILLGRVYDSLVGAGLADVTVRVTGSPESIVTGADGRFELAVEASGDQMVTVSHPKLGLLREDGGRTALLSLGDTTVVEFSVPPLAAFVRAWCGTSRGKSGLVGVALEADGTPLLDVEVVASWRTTTGAISSRRTRSGRWGVYALCDLPRDQPLSVGLANPNGSRAMLELSKQRLDWGQFQWLDLRMPEGAR